MANFTEVLKGRWTVWILSGVFALLSASGVFILVGQTVDQTTYKVLKQDVAARTLITPDMLADVSVNVSGVPPTALSLSDVSGGELFSLVPLKAGTPLTSSVVGPLARINSRLPDGFVIASLTVNAANAVGGRVRAGDYVDIAAVDGDTGNAKVVLHHVLVMDVQVAPDSIAGAANGPSDPSAPGPDSPALLDGIPSLYTLAVTPEDFLVVSLISGDKVYMALSAKDLSVPSGSKSMAEVFGPGIAKDSGKGTEGVFPSSPDTPAPTPSAAP